MEYNLREMNNAILIDSLDRIIKQEIQKLKTDKNTGLIAKKLEQSKVKIDFGYLIVQNI